MRAARSADVEVMKLLLAKGADPKMANKDGLTASMLGAKLARNERGFPPLDATMGKGSPPGASPTPHETTAALIKQLGGTPGEEVKEAPKPLKPATQDGKP